MSPRSYCEMWASSHSTDPPSFWPLPQRKLTTPPPDGTALIANDNFLCCSCNSLVEFTHRSIFHLVTNIANSSSQSPDDEEPVEKGLTHLMSASSLRWFTVNVTMKSIIIVTEQIVPKVDWWNILVWQNQPCWTRTWAHAENLAQFGEAVRVLAGMGPTQRRTQLKWVKRRWNVPPTVPNRRPITGNKDGNM